MFSIILNPQLGLQCCSSNHLYLQKSNITMKHSMGFLPVNTSKKLWVVVKSLYILCASLFFESLLYKLMWIRKCRFYLPALEFFFSIGPRKTQILSARFIFQCFLNICSLSEEAGFICFGFRKSSSSLSDFICQLYYVGFQVLRMRWCRFFLLALGLIRSSPSVNGKWRFYLLPLFWRSSISEDADFICQLLVWERNLLYVKGKCRFNLLALFCRSSSSEDEMMQILSASFTFD